MLADLSRIASRVVVLCSMVIGWWRRGLNMGLTCCCGSEYLKVGERENGGE